MLRYALHDLFCTDYLYNLVVCLQKSQPKMAGFWFIDMRF